MKNIAIIGAGSWGTARVLTAALAGHSVKLWAHSREGDAQHVQSQRRRRFSAPFLFVPLTISRRTLNFALCLKQMTRRF
jgi:glycerol-3-phosphate dehydrogenase (NAD(P)+)